MAENKIQEAQTLNTEDEELAAQATPSSPNSNFANKQNLLITGGILIFAIAITMFLVIKPKPQLLYSELNQSDAAAISAYLQKSKVNFEISPDGSTIGVRNTSVSKLRLELASKGLPKGGGVGFEIFDKTNLTVTDFSQKLNYRRALEGELGRTISSLESIKTARVHLALAPKSIFNDNQTESTASVLVNTEVGMNLNKDQIKGIQHLVASAITNLKPENVQVSDIMGKSLVGFDDEASVANEEYNLNQSKLKSFEIKLENELIDMLSPIVGIGNVLVNVTAQMNFDQKEMNLEIFSPIDEQGNKTGPVIVSEKVATESYDPKQPPAGGVTGTQSNLPTFSGTKHSDEKNDKNYSKEDRTRNFEVSKKIEKIKKASGLLEKVSVAVVINKDLSPAERAELKQTIAVASGIDIERGDQVVVTGIRFSSSPSYEHQARQIQEKQQVKSDQAAMIKKYISLAIALAIGFVVVLILLLSLKSPVNPEKVKELEELLEQEDVPLIRSIDEKIQEVEEAYQRKLSLEAKPSVAQMKTELSRMAVEEPKKIAQGLKTYIEEG